MFYIFLDIDGVLNCQRNWHTPFSLNKNCIKTFTKFVDKIKSIHNDVRIVLSSTWRAGKSVNGNDSAQYEALKDILGEYGVKIYDTTPVSNKGRQREIEYYIKRNNVKDYIVIDDDDSLFERPDEINLYVTDYTIGFTDKDIDKAYKMVEKKRPLLKRLFG